MPEWAMYPIKFPKKEPEKALQELQQFLDDRLWRNLIVYESITREFGGISKQKKRWLIIPYQQVSSEYKSVAAVVPFSTTNGNAAGALQP